MCLTSRQPHPAKRLNSLGEVRPSEGPFALIDYFALALVHGLLVVAFFRLVSDNALDSEGEEPAKPRRRTGKRGDRA